MGGLRERACSNCDWVRFPRKAAPRRTETGAAMSFGRSRAAAHLLVLIPKLGRVRHNRPPPLAQQEGGSAAARLLRGSGMPLRRAACTPWTAGNMRAPGPLAPVLQSRI